MKKIIAGAAVVIALAALIILSTKSKAEKIESPAHKDNAVAAEGKVELMPGFEVEIGSELEGKIAEFPVREGDTVRKGDTIARMESGDIQARLGEAQAALAVAGSRLREVASGAREEEVNSATAVLESARADIEYERTSFMRFRELYQKGIISKDALDEKDKVVKNSEAKVKKAEEEKRLLEKGPRRETIKFNEDAVKRAGAEVEYCQKLLDKTLITAPISGKVIRKYMEAGECATKNRALATIADIGKTWVNAEVDETDIGKIRLGDPAEVRCDAFPGSAFPGEVKVISDYAGIRKVKPNDQAKNMDMKVVEVKIRLKSACPIKSSMTVDVKIKP